MVVTASHNPAADNGVKLVEPSGGTLPMALESVAETLANAEDGDVGDRRCGRCERRWRRRRRRRRRRRTRTRRRASSWRETRERADARSRTRRWRACARWASRPSIAGIATTPQLHYFTCTAANVGADDSERAYYDRLSAGYAALTERDEDEDENDDRAATVVIDCADGVGGVKLSSLGEAVAPYGARV